MTKHNLMVEERFFSEDIKSLRSYDEKFDSAWTNQTEYSMTVMLSVLFEICPRSYQRTLMYKRLIKFLSEKNITLNIVSRKKSNNNNIDNYE